MIKKILFTGLLMGVANAAVANPAPYVGASLGISNTTTNGYPIAASVTQPAFARGIPFSVFVGYGGIVNQNFTLAGEITATLGTAEITNRYGVKNSYGYGASVLPGLMLSDHTLAFGRLGVVRTRFTNNANTKTGAQFGFGLQTTVTQNVDVRGEYNYITYPSFSNGIGSVSGPHTDLFNLALIYKFD